MLKAINIIALIDRVGSPKRCEVDESLRQIRLMLGNGHESAQRCLEIVVHRFVWKSIFKIFQNFYSISTKQLIVRWNDGVLWSLIFVRTLNFDLWPFRSQLCTEKYANVVISSDGLPTGAAQVLISGLAPFVPIDNIYSVSKVGPGARVLYHSK